MAQESQETNILEPVVVPESESIRRSSRRSCKIDQEEEERTDFQEKADFFRKTTFPDPRKRIRDPNLLMRLNEFLQDIGTDPNCISYKDCYPMEENVVFYEPKFPEDSNVLPVKAEQDVHVEQKLFEKSCTEQALPINMKSISDLVSTNRVYPDFAVVGKVEVQQTEADVDQNGDAGAFVEGHEFNFIAIEKIETQTDFEKKEICKTDD